MVNQKYRKNSQTKARKCQNEQFLQFIYTLRDVRSPLQIKIHHLGSSGIPTVATVVWKSFAFIGYVYDFVKKMSEKVNSLEEQARARQERLKSLKRKR